MKTAATSLADELNGIAMVLKRREMRGEYAALELFDLVSDARRLQARVSELLEANNREVERRREAEAKLAVTEEHLLVTGIRRAAQQNGTWPPAVSHGLSLPCSDCGEVPRFGYLVTDEFWRQHVPDNPARLGVVCLPCLDRRSDGRGLADALIEIQWTGTKHSVCLAPTFTHLHADYVGTNQEQG